MNRSAFLTGTTIVNNGIDTIAAQLEYQSEILVYRSEHNNSGASLLTMSDSASVKGAEFAIYAAISTVAQARQLAQNR